MFVREQATQTTPFRSPDRSYFGVTGHNLLKFLSSLILPLMLGIFTVVITFEQQKAARQQRLEDKNESRLQREQDWTIAQLAQTAQNKATSDRYRDEVLVAYIKEIGDLLKENKGSLTQTPLTHTLARVKTLNTIRQLDGPRQIHVLRFLYEAKQLINTDESFPLDISTAKLIDIDFRTFTPSNKLERLSLTGVYLHNCTFTGMIIEAVDFSSSHFTYSDFSSTEFSKSNLSWTRFDHLSFASAKFKVVNFSSAKFQNVDFSKVKFESVNLSFAYLCHSNLSYTEIYDVKFIFTSFKNVTSTFATFQNTDFASASFQLVNFSFAVFENVNFLSARLMEHLDFSFAVMLQANFTAAWFFTGLVNFYRSKLANTILTKCHCNSVNFNYADLQNSSFHNTMLTNTTFILTNLQDADLSKTNITDRQLQSALSIRNAKLPNQTLGQGRNLVRNGDANCGIPLQEYWQVINGSVSVMPVDTNQSQCQFFLRSTTTGAVMSQKISLVDVYDASFWINSDIELRAQLSDGVSIELISKNNDDLVLEKYVADSNTRKILKPLSPFAKILEVIIRFDKNTNQNRWCDNIELFIDYGT